MFHQFMRKIERRPWDVEARLVFADWLEEMGHEAAWGMRAVSMAVPVIRPSVSKHRRFQLFGYSDPHAFKTIWFSAVEAARFGGLNLFKDRPQIETRDDLELLLISVRIQFGEKDVHGSFSKKDLLAARSPNAIQECISMTAMKNREEIVEEAVRLWEEEKYRLEWIQ